MAASKATPAPASPQAGTSRENKTLVQTMREEYLRPITKDSILYYYIPMQGVFCYSAMSINVMNPALFAETLPKRDITNTLLFGSLGGIGLFLYSRPHMRRLGKAYHIGFSAFGSMMFTFGSVLTWAVLRSMLSQSKLTCSVLGLLSAAGLVECGILYCKAIDEQVTSQTRHSSA